jgi:hypothetical protein
MTITNADEMHAGDVVDERGELHRITRVEQPPIIGGDTDAAERLGNDAAVRRVYSPR